MPPNTPTHEMRLTVRRIFHINGKDDAMRRRNIHVNYWMNEAEYKHLKEQAQIAGMGTDPFLRNLVAGVQLRPRPPDQYAKLLRQLSGIANNINQIAHNANARKCTTDADIRELTALVHEAYRLIKETL